MRKRETWHFGIIYYPECPTSEGPVIWMENGKPDEVFGMVKQISPQRFECYTGYGMFVGRSPMSAAWKAANGLMLKAVSRG